MGLGLAHEDVSFRVNGALQLLSKCNRPIRFARGHARVWCLHSFALLTAITSDSPMQPRRTRNKQLASRSKLKPSFIRSRSIKVISTRWIRETSWELLSRTGHLQRVASILTPTRPSSCFADDADAGHPGGLLRVSAWDYCRVTLRVPPLDPRLPHRIITRQGTGYNLSG